HRFMKGLKYPRFAPPIWAWSLVGISYYGIFFVAMFRLTSLLPVNGFAVGLLVTVMAANSFWNYLYFRLRDLRKVFWYSVGYSVMVVVLLASLASIDKISAFGVGIYVAYLPYALALFYRMWQMNPR